jgi:hypothetical protein
MILKYLCLIVVVSTAYSKNIGIFMPHVSPKVKDTYLCHKFKMDPEKPFYVSKY